MTQEYSDKLSQTQVTSSIIVNQTYSYINNTGFYALANPTYYNYYYRFVRRFAWWYDRFVPDFHNAQQGYFSTGIAHSIVDGICNQIVGRKLMLKNDGSSVNKLANETLKRAYKWADSVHFTEKVRNATKFGGALGTSLLKLNQSKKELWLEALRFDDFFFETDFKGNLQEITCLIKGYTDTKRRTVDWRDSDGEVPQQYLNNKYYLVEKRFFKEKLEYDNIKGKIVNKQIPYGIYQVHRYTGTITNAQSWNMSLQEEIRVDSLPTEVRKAINRDFGGILLGKEQRLPFTDGDLGCRLFRYNGSDASLSQQPFGESILTNIISDCMAYDIAFSYAFRDMYQGKGIVFAPKEMQTATSGMTPYSGLEDSLITYLQSPNIDGKLPISNVQFNLRVDEWRNKNNAIYETIATKLNISPSSLASFLSDNTARTAKEVTTEESATDNYIEIQRGALEDAVNGILDTVCKYYGWLDGIKVRFGKSSKNIDTIIDRAIKLKQAELITPYDALKMIYPDADEWEIEELLEKLTEYNDKQQKTKQDIMFGMDFNQTEVS